MISPPSALRTTSRSRAAPVPPAAGPCPSARPTPAPRLRLDGRQVDHASSALDTTFWVTTRTSSSVRPMPAAASAAAIIRQVVAGPDLGDPLQRDQRDHAASPSSSQRARSPACPGRRPALDAQRRCADARGLRLGPAGREGAGAEAEADDARRLSASPLVPVPSRSARWPPRQTGSRVGEHRTSSTARLGRSPCSMPPAARCHRPGDLARLVQPGVQAHPPLHRQPRAGVGHDRIQLGRGADHDHVVAGLARHAQHPNQQRPGQGDALVVVEHGASRVLAAARPRCGTMMRVGSPAEDSARPAPPAIGPAGHGPRRSASRSAAR